MRNPLFFSKRSAFRFTIYFSVSLENVFECNPIIFCQVWITKIWDFLFYTVGPPMRPWHSVNKILIVDPDTDPWCTDTESLLYQTYHQVWSGTAGGIWDQSKQRHVSTVHSRQKISRVWDHKIWWKYICPRGLVGNKFIFRSEIVSLELHWHLSHLSPDQR